MARALGRRCSISLTLPTIFQFLLRTGGVVERESDNSAEIKAFASFSSRIAKFAVMLDVAMFHLPFLKTQKIIPNPPGRCNNSLRRGCNQRMSCHTICPTGETRKSTSAKDRLRRFSARPCQRPGEQVPRPPTMLRLARCALRLVEHKSPTKGHEITFLQLCIKGRLLTRPRTPFFLVSFSGDFVSSKAEPRSGVATARPCAGACPQAQGRGLPQGGVAATRRCWLWCSGAERHVADKF